MIYMAQVSHNIIVFLGNSFDAETVQAVSAYAAYHEINKNDTVYTCDEVLYKKNMCTYIYIYSGNNTTPWLQTV